MSDPMTLDLTAAEAGQVQQLAARCLTATRASNERARQSEGELTQLQAETRALLHQLRTTLAVETTR